MASITHRQETVRTSSPLSISTRWSKRPISTARTRAGRATSAPAVAAAVEDVLVERVAPELEGRDRAAHEAARLGRLVVVLDLVVGEPEAQPLLGQVLLLEVPPEREPAGQEHRRHLGRRLAHLRVEEARLLDHQHRELRHLAAQQQRGRGTREGAAQNDDVVASPIGLTCRSASAASATRSSLPRSVRGSSGTRTTLRGTLCSASRARQKSRTPR